MSYIQVAAGIEHTVLLRSDGTAVACGLNDCEQCNIPPLDEGLSYIQVSAGGHQTLLLRSDGSAVTCGIMVPNIPPLDTGISYTQVSAGNHHIVLLRSDGRAVACGLDDFGACSIPRLDEGISYTWVSAGSCHTVLLRSDGSVIACGRRPSNDACNIPPPGEGLSYVQISAGDFHTVLLQSDGSAVACGNHRSKGHCNIPPLDEGMSYTQISAGELHTVLLRNDGTAVACGDNEHGQCDIPSLKSWRELLTFADPIHCYVRNFTPFDSDHVLQLDLAFEDDAALLTCWDLAGHEVLRLPARRSDLALDTLRRIASGVKVNLQGLRVVLPDGQLLASICEDPLATIADLDTATSPRLNPTSHAAFLFEESVGGSVTPRASRRNCRICSFKYLK